MVRGLPSSEWSMRAWLKCSSWSTASLPTRASPTNSARFTLISCTENNVLYFKVSSLQGILSHMQCPSHITQYSSTVYIGIAMVYPH